MRRHISLLLILLFLNLILWNELPAQQIVTAQVTEVNGSRITIDQGALQGLKTGNEGVIYYMESVAERTVRLEVALAWVVSVTDDSAQLLVFESSAPVKQDYWVDLLVSTSPPTGTVQAKTEKKGGSKWWIWLIVAAAGGGAAAALASKKSSSTPPPAPTTGTFTIHLPAN